MEEQPVLERLVQALTELRDAASETNEAIWACAVELSELNAELAAFLKEVREKGMKMRSV